MWFSPLPLGINASNTWGAVNFMAVERHRAVSPDVSCSDSTVSNPFSTGAGGVTFERLVGESYLVSLLAEDVPRGLDRGISETIAFRQRWAGAVLDDVVITSRTSDGQQRRLALEVKT